MGRSGLPVHRHVLHCLSRGCHRLPRHVPEVPVLGHVLHLLGPPLAARSRSRTAPAVQWPPPAARTRSRSAPSGTALHDPGAAAGCPCSFRCCACCPGAATDCPSSPTYCNACAGSAAGCPCSLAYFTCSGAAAGCPNSFTCCPLVQELPRTTSARPRAAFLSRGCHGLPVLVTYCTSSVHVETRLGEPGEVEFGAPLGEVR